MLAHASSEIPEYETVVPTAEGHKTPPAKAPHSGGETGANTSSTGGGSTSNTSGSTETPESGSSPEGSSGGNNNSSTGSGGGTGQGSGGNGPTAQQSGGSLAEQQKVANATPGEDSSSSPLVPILIAVAVLAAISIGAVVIRQRRQRRGGSGQISPKAS